MEHLLGFVVILILYAVIGFMAAAGAIFIARKFLTPKAEQIFFAMFLIMIAGFYLAFAAYFGAATAWRMETAVVLAFAAIGLAGVRLPFALIIGYPLCMASGTFSTNFSRMEATPLLSRDSSLRSRSPTESFAQSSTFVSRRISIDDAPSGVLRGERRSELSGLGSSRGGRKKHEAGGS
jgi:hypothetical protein